MLPIPAKFVHALYRLPWRHLAISASRGAQKTWSTLKFLLREYLLSSHDKSKRNSYCIYFAQTESMAKTILRPAIIEALQNIAAIGQSDRVIYNKQDGYLMAVHGPNDTRIIKFGSYDQPDRMRGQHVTSNGIVVLDEFGLCSRSAYQDVIEPILTVAGQKIPSKLIVAGTPSIAHGTLFKDKFTIGSDANRQMLLEYLFKKYIKKEPVVNPPKSIESLYWRSVEIIGTDAHSPELLANKEQTMSIAAFQREYMGSWDAFDIGRIFQVELVKHKNKQRPDILYNNKYPVYAAWDLGIECYMSIWIFQVINGQRFFIDYIEGQARPISHYIGILKAKSYHEQLWHILPHDIHGREMTTAENKLSAFEGESYRTLDVKAWIIESDGEKSRISKENCITDSTSIIWNSYFNSINCAKGLQRLSEYEREKNESGEYAILRATPRSKEHQDCVDAFVYAYRAGIELEKLFEIPRVKNNEEQSEVLTIETVSNDSYWF